MTAAVDSNGRQFRAFISYSHVDRRFAWWLHRRIERYRLPAGTALVDHLRPVFLDRAELSAGSDLSAQVQAAIAQSEALIVVASPAALTSRWVNREIELFRTLHPRRLVLVALLSGDWQNGLPPALARDADAEPLAADFRKGGDGRRLGLLKLIAGLAGLPLDRLAQRDAQLRQRRVIAVTVAVAVLAMVLAALLVLALQARAEAEHQRAEAEGMVEFMLTDLRSRLKGVGSLRTMQAVNARAMAYYGGQELGALPDASLERRARLLHAMGEDETRLGDLAGALGKFRESHRFSAAILAREPNNPDRLFAHAQSEFYVGEAALRQGNIATATRHWRGYLALARRLAAVEPGTVRSQMELGYATGNLCELELRARQFAQAETWCEAAEKPMRAAVAKDLANADNALALANRLGWHAEVLVELRRFDDALRYRAEEAAILVRLQATDPENRSLMERATWPMIGTGKALAKAGRTDAALAALREAEGALAALSAAQPDDTGIIEQRLRVAWLESRTARTASDKATALTRARALRSVLARTHTPAQMQRFDKFVTQMEKGN